MVESAVPADFSFRSCSTPSLYRHLGPTASWSLVCFLGTRGPSGRRGSGVAGTLGNHSNHVSVNALDSYGKQAGQETKQSQWAIGKALG